MARIIDGAQMQAARDDLAQSLRRVVADAEALLGATRDEAGDAVDEVRNRLRKNMDEARERLHEAEARLQRDARRAAAHAEDYIHENLWSTLGVAAAAGLVLGLLMSRR